MVRVLVNISYQGSQFLGFQIQDNGRTVQQQFEKILKRMHKRHVRIHPTSRTDRGVHAFEQYFHFDSELNISADQWQYAMNRALPDDVYVNSVAFVDESFHCRYDCVGKTYRYKIYQSAHKDPFECGLKSYVYDNLDFDKMIQAAQLFIGTHDFTGFCSQKTEVESKVRTLYESRIEKTTYGFDYVVTGSGFLYNMVRVLVAFLIGVGKGKYNPESVPQLLEEKNRNKVPFTAPAEGLYLEHIYLSPQSLMNDFGENIKIHRKKSTQNR
ncbi:MULTISPECIES: tRNA pseudouridine(38-40) synthase TruA [Staphylococcus]|jgi:tRNA pseudouridine38-40 synthase|uniref:tRNA pseudouridine(38-40) synthase TruA n=1 Tax=Staphylococcus TaxID=1279 RepID=UPI000E6A2D8D|nr:MULTISPECIES: tRNA pseudouridine(38-40) synthase TruA [Staphylococcus]MBO1205852.1 tRNA pseudouridine(38-40) synthase TruA [Staphylococcus nepalensis]MDW8552181.1 tRNA pseudouridine(38-40) synthase TruA [Staphylococcus nepalensis]RIO45110.1 tRNA pseudouridine(38-40) synthase TruA [Staphylococcus nepalensis]WQL20963.1 tRNA pseudouridine(38-40) synthase TruA [Staphylococcus nepalensis]